MKIDLEIYGGEIEKIINKVRSKGQGKAVLGEIKLLVSEFLPCSSCRELLPKDSFSKASSFTARGGRYSICKACCSAERKK